MLRHSICILFICVLFEVGATDQECEERCTRLKHRSLDRVGYDDERLHLLFERQRPLESLKDVCWRLYDNLDCMKKCKRSEKHAAFAKLVKNKCKFVLSEMEPTLKCISKHQSFLKMRCSAFLNEASKLRSETDLSTTPRHDECRFLHLNAICLENNVELFCKNGKKLFKRLKFRDYFLNYALPIDDTLFDDEDLDTCQIYDFMKDTEKQAMEEEERRKEEEKRRRIEEEDEDYEQELTTIVNKIEGTENAVVIESTTTVATTTIVDPTQMKKDKEKEEFTELIDELIDSAEREEKRTSTASPEHEQASEQQKESSVHTEEKANNDQEHSDSKHHEEEHIVEHEEEEEHLEPVIPSPHDEDYSEDYHENENSTHPTISVVSIETRASTSASEEQETTTLNNFAIHLTPPNDVDPETESSEVNIETTTPKRKVFSEDSMEQTPPNFFYSSVRSSGYDSTTRSNYVADNMDDDEGGDLEKPLDIDTSTLFGIEPTEGMKDQAKEGHEDERPSKPWLAGGVVVKPILKFNQQYVDEEEQRESEHRRKLEELASQYHHEHESNEKFNKNREHEAKSYENFVAFGVISIVICLLLLILSMILVCYCTSKRQTYDVQKNSIENAA